MDTDSSLAHPDTLPEQIKSETRDQLRTYLERHWKRKEEKENTSNKVSKELCSVIKRLYEQGMTMAEIVDYAPVSSKTAISYHVNDKCSHDYRMRITYDECGWMRYHASKGAPSKTLATLYNVSQKNASRHITGKCSHDHGLEPVSGDKLFRNSRTKDTNVTSTCPECGEKFTHPHWKDQKYCSRQCNLQKAARASAKARSTD